MLNGGGTRKCGIVTDYKGMMNGKREIPASSCPSSIAERMYGTVHTGNAEKR